MKRTKETLEARVRETPLLDRLKECRQRIGKMCSEGRPPRMCIPVQHDDDDFFISTTLADAQATVEALQAQLRLSRFNQANAEAEYNGLQAQIRALTQQLDAEREKVVAVAKERDVQCTLKQNCIGMLEQEREKVKGLEAQNTEWERKCRDLCQAHGVLLIEHHDVKKDLTTLQQLVAALPVVDVQEVSVWLSPDESGWLVSKRPAFPAGLYWAKFRTQAEADSFRSLLAYRATLAAKDAGKVCTNHFSDGSKIFPSRHCECKPHPTEERHE